MKINKSTKKINKPALITAAILLIGLIAFSVYFFILKPHSDSPVDSTPSNTSSSNEQPSKNSQEAPTGKGETPNTDVPPAPTTNDATNKKQVQMVASVDQSNDTVFIRGGVNYPVRGGSCYAQLSGPSGQSIRKDSVELPNPASTDCKTISIPESELGSGKWTVTLNYESDEYEGVSNEVSFAL